MSLERRAGRLLALICGLSMAWGVTSAQIPGALTNEELNLQKLFIEANREKLLGSYDKAAELYLLVLKEDPRNDAAAYELSRVYDSMGELDNALEKINTAVRINRDNPWYLLMKADILEKLENYGDAIDVYSLLTEISPKENYYYLHQADLLLKTNQPDRALETLNNLEQNTGVLPDIVEYKVEILDGLQRYDDAISELEKILRLYPQNLKYLHLIASFCEKANRKDDAEGYYARILDIAPDDAKANLAVADKYRSEGEDAAYLRTITPIMENPAIELDAKIAELIPFVERYAENPDPAYADVLEELISGLVSQYNDEAKTHALYADFLYHSRRLSDAAREYERTIVLDKKVYPVWEQLMLVQAELRDMDGVLRTSEDALNVFPNQGSIYYMRGLAYASKQDYTQAESELQQALLMSGRNQELHFNVLTVMGKVYVAQGEDDKAVEAFDKALDINANDTDLLVFYSAYLTNKIMMLDKAKSMASKALESSPDNPEIEHILSQIAMARGNTKEARSMMENAMNHGAGDNYLSLELYGDILYKDGESDDAVEYWILSQQAGNTSEVLKRKISERKLEH